MREKVLREGHPAIAESLLGLGKAQLALHQPARAIAPLERALAMPEMAPLTTRASTEFTLAKALAELGRERERARKLALQARDGYSRHANEPSRSKLLAEITDWLRRH